MQRKRLPHPPGEVHHIKVSLRTTASGIDVAFLWTSGERTAVLRGCSICPCSLQHPRQSRAVLHLSPITLLQPHGAKAKRVEAEWQVG